MRSSTLSLLTSAAATPSGQRQVYFGRDRGFVDTPIYQRESLVADTLLQGPAVIEQMDTNTLVPPDSTCRVDDFGNLILESEQ